MNDEEVIGYILAGLGPGHSDIFTAITILSNERKVTLPEFNSYLIAHEAQAKAMGNTVEFTSSANTTSRQDANNPPRHNSPNNNGYNNHSNNYQQGNYRGGSGRGRGRERGRNYGGPRCQVYGIPGHIASNCINRFNHAYQAKEQQLRSGNSVTGGNCHPDNPW